MIEFKGIPEREWLATPGHRVKAILKDLEAYRSKNKQQSCPFMR